MKATVKIEPWPRGRCEAGVVTFSQFGGMTPCDHRGRWLVDGVILCGSCKRLAERRGLL